MISSTSKASTVLGRKYPVLKNFPFKEFEIEAADPPTDGFFIEEDEAGLSRIIDPKLIRFIHKSPIKSKKGFSSEISVVIFEQELNWICGIAEKIDDLDRIAKLLDRALKSDNLLLKRDAVEEAQVWCTRIEDGRTRLSYSTIGDILASLVKDKTEFAIVVNKLMSLSTKKGLVSLTESEYEVIMTHYQFQLIYTKLVLGIVIASKISI